MYLKLILSLFIFLIILEDGDCISKHKSYVKLPECEACERLVDSFMKGIERTEKGNHAGGNTAWEESQLGSYATSEVRLVEIQEGLCEDNRTTMEQCLAMAEDLEQHLEKWWFKDRWEAPDLRHYLCVKKVKYCYPKLTSSVSTSSSDHRPSPDSEALKCPEGWEISSSGVCEDVNECNHYPCKDNEYCKNTEGSYICYPCHEHCQECFGAGPQRCTVYKSFLSNFVANISNLYNLSMIGSSFIFAYIFIFLCSNLMFKMPLMPGIFFSFLVICVGVKMFLNKDSSSEYRPNEV